MTFSPVVTCSDASLYGGAVATAEALGSAGQQLAHRLGSGTAEPLHVDLLVISAFNGIGGAFRGFDLAGVKPAGLIAIEWGPSSPACHAESLAPGHRNRRYREH